MSILPYGGYTMFRTTVARALILLLLVAIAFPALASRYAYIPRSGNNLVSVLDTQTNTVVANIAVTGGPWGVATHPAGTRVYVPGQSSGTVAVINTATNTVIANVTVGSGPYHAAVSPDGTVVYVPNYGSASVSIISTASNTVTGTISGLSQPNAVAFSPSGDFAYVTSYTSGALYIINTSTLAVTTVAGMSTQSEGIAVHPSGRYVYTVGNNASVVSILDTTTNAITTTANIGSSVWGVAVHPNGRYFYVTRSNNDLRVFRTSDNVQVALIALNTDNRGPTGISLSPSGNFAYVANRTAASVTVVNTVTNTVATTIASGNAPRALGTAIQRPLFGHGSIASGQYHSCRVRGDQTVNCWGRDDFGQATAPAGTFTQVVAGSAHTCGLRTNGTVACWGNNTYNQATPATGTFQLISSGARHVCGIRADSSVACWGENDQGQATPATGTNFQGIAAGSSHTCGLRSTGAISCWGRNAEGQSTAPVGSYLQVVTGSAFTCGLTSANAAVCWGDATGGKTSPTAGSYTKLSAQSGFACGINFNGGMSCWGSDKYGETLAPAIVHADVAAGRWHTCSLKAQGVAQCWGWNLYNEAPQFELTPLALTSGTTGVVYAGTQNIAMSVNNAGTRYPYVPRTPAFAVVVGSLPPGMALSVGGVLSGTPTLAGTYNFTVQGEDANGFVAERAYSLVVGNAGDATAPVITAQVQGLAGNNGWYRGNVVVSWTVVDPQSQVTNATGCGTVVVSVETVGQLITCQATSAGGTASQSVTIKLDKTAPTASPKVTKSRPLLNEIIAVSANGADALSGVASEVCEEPSTAVISPVQKRINCTVTDAAGNVAVKAASYPVLYGFSGFTDTVINPGYYNLAGLSQAITFKFNIVDANGTPVTDITSAVMASESVGCPTATKNVVPVSASPVGLVHVGGGNYEFTWISPAVAACVRLNLQLGDGNTINRALFKFE
jgi:YVTN family beta-propeller protein